MKNNLIMRSALFCVLLACVISVQSALAKRDVRQFYEVKIYHMANKEQVKTTDNYLKDAYLPALHRAGLSNIGVFKPIGNDTAKDMRIYVLIPMASMKQYTDLPAKLSKDQALTEAGKDYIDASHKNPPYKRIETLLLQAFADMPKLKLPALTGTKQDRVYELRSYEAATEKSYKNKVHMFNEGKEIAIFHKLKFNPIFFAEVLAGSNMPNLMYMTSFENKASRDEHWKSFSADSDWKTVSSMPNYQNNVSKADILFLYPASYSDI